ncbi:MAG: class I SAM-dependent methyltransferase [Anaerolineae bacterium]|nr:methyltransferase domain-containing protein [Anaerolineae bacterium]
MSDILQQQIDYYNARAAEYDASILQPAADGDNEEQKELATLIASMRLLDPVESALELACGTGIWTRRLAHIAQQIVALDASAEMLALNKRKVNSERVEYRQVDLFKWQPDREYDLVFAAFWLSHIPADLMDDFLRKVASATNPEGRAIFIDEPQSTVAALAVEDGDRQTRSLADGRTFQIIKIYYDPEVLREKLIAAGFADADVQISDYFFRLEAWR